MKQLFAPWRMAYILSADQKPAECIFCAYPAHGQAHREHLVLMVGRHAFVMMNRYPFGNGHVMVVPRRHVAHPCALEAAEWAATCELLRQSTTVLGETLGAADFNIGMNIGRAAGAGIADHCHWHIVPRWPGDTNFMPMIAEIRVINEHLDATYDKLLPRFTALSGDTTS